jgi:hypothetical protein
LSVKSSNKKRLVLLGEAAVITWGRLGGVVGGKRVSLKGQEQKHIFVQSIGNLEETHETLAAANQRPLIAMSRYFYRSHHRRVAFHRRYVLGRLIEGHLTYRYNGFEAKMDKETLYLFQPNSLLVDVDCRGGCEVDYYHLDEASLNWVLDGFGVEPNMFAPYHSIKLNPDFESGLEDLNASLRATHFRTELQNEMLINLVDLLLDACEAGRLRSTGPYEINPEMILIKERIAKGAMASNFLQETPQFIAQFGATPEEMEGAVRAETVRELLEKGVSLKQAAEQLGLANESSLSELFRQSWVVHPDLYQGIALGVAPSGEEASSV